MFDKLLKKLEDPKRPLLGPNVILLKFFGLLLPEQFGFKKCFYIISNVALFTFLGSEFIEILFVRSDFNSLLNNVKYSLLAVVGVAKIASFLYWQSEFKSLLDYATKVDLKQRGTENATKFDIIDRNMKYCRKITYIYCSLVVTTVVFLVMQPIWLFFSSPTYRENVRNGTDTYVQILSSYVPFNKNTIPGYIGASLIQTCETIHGSGWIAAFDSHAIVFMVFFKGELELLRLDCADIFGTENKPVSDDEARRRIVNCHERYVELTLYAKKFNNRISPIMFLYMLVCSIMLCVTAYQVTAETSIVQRFLISEFLVYGVAQLFFYCWHSNNVYYTSMSLQLGPYESVWWMRKASLQKEIFMLSCQYKEPLMFDAGPFTKLNVSTFINILKGAYSFYTLLSQSQTK